VPDGAPKRAALASFNAGHTGYETGLRPVAVDKRLQPNVRLTLGRDGRVRRNIRLGQQRAQSMSQSAAKSSVKSF